MANIFCLGTLNVRGLNNKPKRRVLYNHLKTHKIDIACLQETYIKKDTLQEIEREWRGKIFHKQGTNRSNGLLILVSNRIMHEEMEIIKQTERILILKVKINNTVHTIVNCYAPNTTTEKIQFFRQLEEEIQKIETDALWLARRFQHYVRVNRQHCGSSSSGKRNSST